MSNSIESKGSTEPSHQYTELHLENQLSFSLYSTTNKMVKLYKILLKPMNITFSQYMVLMALWEKSPLTINEIAATIALEGNTVTPLVKRMEAVGVVSRSRDSLDERKVKVSVTHKGYELRAKSVEMRRKLVSGLGLDEQQLRELRSQLRGLSEFVSSQLDRVD